MTLRANRSGAGIWLALARYMDGPGGWQAWGENRQIVSEPGLPVQTCCLAAGGRLRTPTMNYRALGRTGLSVSEIGFGAWGMGGRTAGHTSYGETDDATSLAALSRALDCGITFFDTSSAYGDGHSEALIGRAFKHSRARVVIATKAGYDSWDRAPDFSPAAIVASVERSLARLQSYYVDTF